MFQSNAGHITVPNPHFNSIYQVSFSHNDEVVLLYGRGLKGDAWIFPSGLKGRSFYLIIYILNRRHSVVNQLGLGYSSSVCGPHVLPNLPAAPVGWTNPETTLGHLQAWFSVAPLAGAHGGSAHLREPVLRNRRERKGRIWVN